MQNNVSKATKYALTIRLPQDSPPRAIALVFGWAFSRKKDVLKYSELYRGCATITGILPPLSVAVKNDAVIADFCREAMKEAAKLIEKYEGDSKSSSKPPTNIPILIHAMCNGGGFCRLGIHQALERTNPSAEDTEATHIHTVIRDRLAAEILDSAPVYISTKSSLAALAGVVKNPLVFWMLAIGGTVANYCKYFWSLLTTGEAFYTTYWNDMKASDACPHQCFVYSTADTVADHQKVDDFVDFRKTRAAKGTGSVEVLKVNDTGHCRHLQGHREEYCDLVERAIQKAIAEMEDRNKKRSRL